MHSCIWRLFHLISCCSLLYCSHIQSLSASTANQPTQSEDYTYFFETKRYHFKFDFDYDLRAIEQEQEQAEHAPLSTTFDDNNVVITNRDLSGNDIDIEFDHFVVDVLFFVNTSSYMFNIDRNATLNYDYDADWNEIQTLILTSPSQQQEQQEQRDDELPFPQLYVIEEDDHDDEDDEHNVVATFNNMTDDGTLSRRRLYVHGKRRGSFIGVKHPRQFHDAERVCRHRFGGELASINSGSENSRANRLCKSLGKSSCWIGLRRPFRQWTDGRKVDYKKWSPGEPNNAGRRESCTELYRNGKWNDNRCRRTRPFICEKARVKKRTRYVGVAMALDWDNANEYCHRRFSTELATIKSEDENKKVRSVCNSVARKGSCWIGLERPFKKWQDGSRVKYTHWQPGEPNNHGTGESCTEIYRSKRWNDLSCRGGRFFVCNYKGVDNTRGGGRGRRSRRSRSTKRRRRRKRRGSCRRGSREQRRRCRRRRRRGRRSRWKCMRLKFDDYERKECMRQRRNMRRRFGRREARARWRNKLSGWMGGMQGRGYGGISGMGSGYRSGFIAGKQSMMGTMGGMGRGLQSRLGGGMPGMPSMMGGIGGSMGGMGAMGGLRSGLSIGRSPLSGLGGSSLRSLQSSNGIPAPPRIKLIDLPQHMRGGRGRTRSSAARRLTNGRLHPGQLGTGMGIGMTHKLHDIPMPMNLITNALQHGASMKDLAKDAYATDMEYKQFKKAQQSQLNFNDGKGFGGFRGFDGFGSGYLPSEKEKDKRRRREKRRRGEDVEATQFGLDKKRRRLVHDETDVDVYQYGEMENERKCVVYQHDVMYQVCVGYDVVEITKFVRRVPKVMNANLKQVALQMSERLDTDDPFMQYMSYEHAKCKAMTKNVHGHELAPKLKTQHEAYTHYVSAYEFLYDVEDDHHHHEQCAVFLQPLNVCLYRNEQNQMMMNVVEDEGDEDEEQTSVLLNFAVDSDWNEVNEISEEQPSGAHIVVEKCVRLFATKICMLCENDTQYKLMMYKTH